MDELGVNKGEVFMSQYACFMLLSSPFLSVILQWSCAFHIRACGFRWC